MHFNKSFKLRTIAGENLVVQTTSGETDMTKIISLNSSSAWLWRELEGKDFTEEEVVEILLGHYDVSPEQAQKDVSTWIKTLTDNNIIE